MWRLPHRCPGPPRIPSPFQPLLWSASCFLFLSVPPPLLLSCQVFLAPLSPPPFSQRVSSICLLPGWAPSPDNHRGPPHPRLPASIVRGRSAVGFSSFHLFPSLPCSSRGSLLGFMPAATGLPCVLADENARTGVRARVCVCTCICACACSGLLPPLPDLMPPPPMPSCLPLILVATISCSFCPHSRTRSPV